MEFKKATIKDTSEILNIVKIAMNHMKEENNPQWVDEDAIMNSIINYINNNQYYLAIKNNEIVGIFALILTKDETYDVIDGKWLNNEKYITIHKIAVKYHKQHIASDILNFIIDLAKEKSINNIRIDTSSLNKSMTTFLEKNNFKYCGVISITKNFNDLKSHRNAYQKELSKN